jgi:uncharacterized membrane-anchored protein
MTRSDRGGKRRAGTSPALSGHEVRAGRDIHDVVSRTGAGDVVVIDRLDLEPEIARALVARRVHAVLNVTSFLSGRYPTGGPLLLARAGVVLIERVGRSAAALRDGERVHVDGTVLRRGDTVVAEGTRRTVDDLQDELTRIRSSGGVQVRAEAMVADTVSLLRQVPGLVDGGAADATLVGIVDGRPVVVADATWPSDQVELLRRAGNDPGWVVVAAGDDAARALGDVGVAVDAVVVPAGAPVRITQVGPVRVQASFASQPLDGAVLCSLLAGSPAVVPVGRESEDLAAVLDQARSASAVTGLSRLVGAGRIVDAEALGALRPAALSGSRAPRRSAEQGRRRMRQGLVAAAAAGLVVGAVLGLGPLRSVTGADDDLERSREQVAALEEEQRELSADLAQGDAFGTQVQQLAVAGRLEGRRLALIVAPGADDAVTVGVRTVVEQAGGAWSATVRLTPTYWDPDRATSLDDIALRLAPEDAELPSDQGAGARRDAAVSAALVATGEGAQDTSEASAGVLAALGQVGALTVEGDPRTRAQLAVMIVPNSTDPSAAQAAALAQDLGARGGVVVVTGAPLEPGSSVAVLRGAAPPPAGVSTVDGAARVPGRVSVVEAADAAFDGTFGSYGRSASSATSPVTPAPG